MAKAKKTAVKKVETKSKSKLNQADVPAYSLEQCLRVPEAIIANYARRPTAPLKVAQAMNVQPKSSNFRMLTGAGIAYGLIKGGAQAPLIEVLPLAIRILRPTKEGDELSARREALLKPKVVGQFLRNYAGNLLPREDIAKNVLVEMGVPEERASDVLVSILGGARQVGFIQTIKGKEYIYLDSEGESSESNPQEQEVVDSHGAAPPDDTSDHKDVQQTFSAVPNQTVTNGKVFITHGKNKAFLESLKKMISLMKLEPVVTVEKQTVSQPLPDKVVSDMRSCSSAIIHVDAERVLKDDEGNDQIVVNSNVLIEIGAALALYGRRFILLVRRGVELPSNLSGLYEVRYDGDSMDATVTLKLLEALADVQNHALPDRYSNG